MRILDNVLQHGLDDCQCWQYAGEGGKHAIFSHQPPNNDTTGRVITGILLRLSKQDLARSSTLPSVWNRSVVGHASEDSSRSLIRYIRNVVMAAKGTDQESLLANYMDIPTPVRVTWDFVRLLREQTLRNATPSKQVSASTTKEPTIPQNRYKDWFPQPDMTIRDGQSHVVGLLLYDYRRRRPTSRPCDTVPGGGDILLSKRVSGPGITVELKPKQGYVAVSPLVNPLNRIKFFHNRFVLLQHLYANKGPSSGVAKPWLAHVSDAPTREPEATAFVQSSYDPCDLFSGDIVRIRQALQSLIACPQNNLKVWYETKLLIGYSSETSSHMVPDWETIRLTLGDISTTMLARVSNDVGVQDKGTTTKSALINVVSTIFEQEPVLSNLLQLQQLDVVDADGAILLYDRLVELCGGSMDQADALLDYLPDASVDRRHPTNGPPRLTLLAASPLVPPSDCSRIDKLCHQVHLFQEILTTLREGSHSSTDEMLVAELDNHHKQARAVIQTMDQADCQYLLQLWLLSLTMNDISILVNFHVQNNTEDRCASAKGSMDDTPILVSRQMAETPGELLCRCMSPNNEPTSISIHYSVKIIDFDQKPAKKLRTRLSKEKVFGSFDAFKPIPSLTKKTTKNDDQH